MEAGPARLRRTREVPGPAAADAEVGRSAAPLPPLQALSAEEAQSSPSSSTGEESTLRRLAGVKVSQLSGSRQTSSLTAPPTSPPSASASASAPPSASASARSPASPPSSPSDTALETLRACAFALTAAREAPDTSAALLEALQNTFASGGAGVQTLAAHAGCLEAVTASLLAHPSHPATQAAGCAAVWILASGNPFNAFQLGSAGAVSAAASALASFPESPARQGAACGALRALCSPPGCADNTRRALSSHLCLLDTLSSALHRHGEKHVGLAESGFSLLAALSRFDHFYLADSSVGELSLLCSAAIEAHAAASFSSPAALAASSSALAGLLRAAGGPDASPQTADASLSALPPLIASLHAHRASRRTLEAVCSLLALLLEGSPERCLGAAAAGGVNALTCALFSAGASLEVQRSALSALLSLLTLAPEEGASCERALEAGALEAAASALELHAGDGEVAVKAAGVISEMLEWRGSREGALRAAEVAGVRGLAGAARGGGAEVVAALDAMLGAMEGGGGGRGRRGGGGKGETQGVGGMLKWLESVVPSALVVEL